jgi:hypothetical protein
MHLVISQVLHASPLMPAPLLMANTETHPLSGGLKSWAALVEERCEVIDISSPMLMRSRTSNRGRRRPLGAPPCI